MTTNNLPLLSRLHPLSVIFGTLLLVIVPFLLWASNTSLDQISHAPGQVIAAAKTQQIQAANDGVIEEVYVKEGQSVKKGETLAALGEKDETGDVYMNFEIRLQGKAQNPLLFLP